MRTEVDGTDAMPVTARTIIRRDYKKAIPDEVRASLRRLQVKDNWRNALYLGLDWAAVAAAIALCTATGMNPLAYLAVVVVIGSRQRALMNLVHQGSHSKLFRNRTANDLAGRLFAAFPLLTVLSAYTRTHRRHHGYLWDVRRDPKTVRYGELGLVVPPEDGKRFFRLHVLRPLFLAHAAHNVTSAFRWGRGTRGEVLCLTVFWALAGAAVVWAGLAWEFLLFWVVPFCTSFQIIRYWAEMAEHAGLRSDDPWTATRSWESSPLVRWLLAPHDDAYHLAHHLFPLIPHYRLREAHRLLMRVPEYAGAHHCDGFFWPRRPNAPSVVQDMRRPGGARVASGGPSATLRGGGRDAGREAG